MAATTTATAVKLAEERSIIIDLAHQPHLSNDYGDITIDPFGMWITYRLEAGATEHTWHAQVSGYRVRPHQPTDPADSDTISLRSSLDPEFPGDEAPEWLAALIEAYTPTW